MAQNRGNTWRHSPALLLAKTKMVAQMEKDFAEGFAIMTG